MNPADDGGRVLIGCWVRSSYRAPWRGQVVGGDHRGVLTVRVYIDRHGNPMRKPLTKLIGRGWLVRVPPPAL